MMKDMNPGQMSGMCEWKKSGCEEKGEKCKTSEDSKVYDEKCDGIAEDKDKLEAAKDTCCTLGKSLVDCYSKECMVLMEASMSFEGDKAEKEDKKNGQLAGRVPRCRAPHAGRSHGEDKGARICRFRRRCIRRRSQCGQFHSRSNCISNRNGNRGDHGCCPCLRSVLPSPLTPFVAVCH